MTDAPRGTGPGPLHLLALLACFAVAARGRAAVAPDPLWRATRSWFVGAAVAHDLVLFPLYALLDRSASAWCAAGERPRPPR